MLSNVPYLNIFATKYGWKNCREFAAVGVINGISVQKNADCIALFCSGEDYLNLACFAPTDRGVAMNLLFDPDNPQRVTEDGKLEPVQ